MRSRFALLILLLVSLVSIACAAAQSPGSQSHNPPQDITGDWQGTFDTGVGQLHLILHVSKAADGSLKASLDSVDQGAHAIPVSSISLKGSHLEFVSDAVHGSYNGTVSADASAIEGTWSQGKPLPLAFKRAAAASEIDGYWLGTLDAGGTKLRVAFRITNTPEGLHATLDSLDQGANGIPVSSIVREGAQLRMEVKAVSGTFSGTIAKDLTSIDGTWKQGGASLPLLLKKTKEEAAEKYPKTRPQDPVKPYPYREEEVSYTNKAAAGVTLAATLTLPQGKGPFPAVVLITGSGPQNRNEEIMGHRPFLVLSDYLTRRGIAVLRADDRGIGKSTGDFASATTADFATDAEAGVAYLKSLPEINARRIGLVGHSEGAVIAPMVAARNSDVAFIVMLAGTGVPGDQIIAEQTRLIAIANHATPEAAQAEADQQRELLQLVREELVREEKDSSALEAKVKDKLAKRMGEAQAGMAIKQLSSPWLRYFIDYDPAPALRRVTCPVLVLNGEKDLQVSPKQNLPAIRKALEEGRNKHFEIEELPGLNHLFQTAHTGSPLEYSKIQETMSPAALEKIANWIASK